MKKNKITPEISLSEKKIYKCPNFIIKVDKSKTSISLDIKLSEKEDE